MGLDIHIYHHFVEDNTKLDEILKVVKSIKKEEDLMSQQLENLKVAVAANKEIEESAITLITGLAAQIAELKDDPVALQNLADEVTAEAAKLAAKILENTPQG